MADPLVPSDLFRIVLLSDPQIAPDGAAIYYRRTRQDEKADEARGSIHRVDRNGIDRQLTRGTNDRLPRVAPDGSALAYVSDRDGKARILLLPLDGGEPAELGGAYAKVTALTWAPDAKRIAFIATAEHDPATARVYLDEKSQARHVKKLPYKSDADGLFDGARKHLYLADVASGEVRALTAGDFDAASPAWSPDGAKIAYTARVDAPEWSTSLSDLFVVDVASGAATRLTENAGPLNVPSFSHDGREIALIGHQHGDDGGGRFDEELLLISAGGGGLRSLSAGLGRTIGDHIAGDLRGGHGLIAPAWSADDKELIVQVCDEGATSLRAFARDGSGTRIVAGGERQIYGFSVASDGTIALVFSTPVVPNEIAVIERYGGERVLTAANPWLSEKIVAAPKRYRPRADDGTMLDAWLIVPAKGGEDRPPLILEVHGGPHAAYGWAFFLEFQVLAGQGFAVCYGNPRGSQSYGHAYANAITGDWGGIDVGDVLRILDGALQQGRFDAARLGAAGGSYGGFMTTWLLGHEQRFAAGVSMRAVNDHVSMVGASDLGWFLERELKAPYDADDGRRLFDISPMRAARAISAPLLVEHSERDYRCPIDQAEQLFVALRRFGPGTTEFVRFADTGHEMSRSGKPRSRMLRLRAIAHWFIRHLKPAGATPAPDEAGALFRPLAGEPESAA